jgi:DNA-binding XRE family transcriptional regulator
VKNNIKKYLKISGKKTNTIIRQAQVARSTFYAILNSNQVPKIDTACKIARALDVPVSDVFPDLKELPGGVAL